MEKSVNFNRAAEYYDATRGFPEGVDKDVAAFMVQEGALKPNEIILDIGIGTGRIALPLAPHVGLITGVDISRDMLNVLLRKRQQEAVFPLEGDGYHLPYADKSFDAAVVVHVFHLVPDPLRLLQEIGRTLKPEGRLLHCFTNHEAESPSPLMQAWNLSRGHKAYDQRWDKTISILKSTDWLVEKEVSYWYSFYEAPRHYFEMIGKRAWSSTWELSDEEIDNGVKAMQKVLDEQFGGDLDTPIERKQGYQMQIMRPPA